MVLPEPLGAFHLEYLFICRELRVQKILFLVLRIKMLLSSSWHLLGGLNYSELFLLFLLMSCQLQCGPYWHWPLVSYIIRLSQRLWGKPGKRLDVLLVGCSSFSKCRNQHKHQTNTSATLKGEKKDGKFDQYLQNLCPWSHGELENK